MCLFFRLQKYNRCAQLICADPNYISSIVRLIWRTLYLAIFLLMVDTLSANAERLIFLF